jgi:hypothetical protein
MLTKAAGVPLSVEVAAASRHDMKLVAATLAHRKCVRPVDGRTIRLCNRFRRLLVRSEKREDTYCAMLQFACGLIAGRSALSKQAVKVHHQKAHSQK